jgi:predicted transcriptional regulator
MSRLSMLQLIVALVVSLGGGAISVAVMQTRTQDRLEQVETSVERNRAERDKQMEEVRSHTVSRDEFNARWEHVQADLKEIKEGVREIRAGQQREHAAK